jgi:ERCC4-type nuclease
MNVQETCDLIISISQKTEKNLIKNIKPLWCRDIGEAEVVKPYTSVVKKVKKANITKENIGIVFLSQIPGISDVMSEVIIKKYGSIKELIFALNENSKCLEGMTYIHKGKERKISSTVIKNVEEYL